MIITKKAIRADVAHEFIRYRFMERHAYVNITRIQQNLENCYILFIFYKKLNSIVSDKIH